MNAQNTEKKPVIKRETKNKIRVEFERTPFKQRFKEKFLSFHFLQTVVVKLFWYILMIGISYVILEPFISQILRSFMAPDDFVDVTVNLIPRNFSLDIYKGIFNDGRYFKAMGNTLILSVTLALVQTFICCFIGYGFAKFKFRGRNFIFMMVMLTMIIPHKTLYSAIYNQVRNFDILGIVRLLKGGGIELFGWNIKDLGEGVASFFEALNVLPDKIQIGMNDGLPVYINIRESGLNLAFTYAPLYIFSLCGLAFKNGLYIFLLRQFFRGIPDELEESAYMDGCGTFHTFFRIILPLSVPMMVTVFLFAFCWQWTDVFYINLIETNTNFVFSTQMLSDVIGDLSSNKITSLALNGHPAEGLYTTAISNTFSMLIIAPLVVLYAFCQNFLVQGIEHSGIAN